MRRACLAPSRSVMALPWQTWWNKATSMTRPSVTRESRAKRKEGALKG